jgi:hypothetical protein
LYSGLYKSTRQKIQLPIRLDVLPKIDFSPVISGLGKHTIPPYITITAKERATSLLYLVCMPLKKTKLNNT